MPLLVDAYNVLHVTGVLPPHLAGVDVEGLAALIASSRFGRMDAWLVCDGRARDGAKRRWLGRHIVAQYAGSGIEADDAIDAIVAGSSSPRRLIVVSSDGRVVRGARKRRCRVESAESFLQKLVHDAGRIRVRVAGKPERPLGPDEVERWVRLFGLDDDVLRMHGSTAPKEAAGSPPTDKQKLVHVATRPVEGAKRRALEGVARLDEVDPAELERFDMGEWLR
jgi:hypothetical protein